MGESKRGFQEIKRLNEIKTTTGLIGSRKVRKPHEAYIELSSLEIERHRLGKEKEKAESRIEFINKRFEEIDKKITALLQFIERPVNVVNKKNKKQSKTESIPSYRVSPEDIRERTITY